MKMHSEEHLADSHLVMPMLLAALFANFLLFSVSYTNASFSGVERALPNFGLSQVSYQVDHTINLVVDNFAWAVNTTAAIVQPKVLAFLGLNDYSFGAMRATSLALLSSAVAEQTMDASTPQVLGVSIVNPLFSQ